jgi:hypothetical protein
MWLLHKVVLRGAGAQGPWQQSTNDGIRRETSYDYRQTRKSEVIPGYLGLKGNILWPDLLPSDHGLTLKTTGLGGFHGGMTPYN